MKSTKKLVAMIIAASLFIPMISTTTYAASQNNTADVSYSENSTENNTVNIQDENLRNAILQQLGKDSDYTITVDDMKSITSLVYSYKDKKISSLSGLEYCTNLTYLNLAANDISDLSPLAGLLNLESLELPFNSLNDISPLSKLTNLKDLDLRFNKIKSISALKNLTNLNKLYLCFNSIDNISSLSNLKSLEILWLQSNDISDISALENLSNLKNLMLMMNSIYDISPLKNLNSLTDCSIESQGILSNKFRIHSDGSFKNPLINLDGTPITSITETDGCFYNAEENTVYKTSRKYCKTLNFSQDVKIGSVSSKFSGTIYF